MSLSSLNGTTWSGTSTLWLRPGADAQESDATATIEGGVLRYEWAYEGKPQTGELTVTEDGASWSDSWHQPERVEARSEPDHGALLAVAYDYSDPPQWHWRIRLCQRPDETLVLQMTNVTPWGEEALAVQMVLTTRP